MIDEPVQNACGSLRKPNSDGGPEDPLLGPGAQVLGDQRQREGELQREVAVAGGVEAVGRHAVEAQAGRATSSRSIGRLVPASAAAPSGSTFARRRQSASRSAVALELLAVGQPIVRGQHRLGPLQVGIAGQDHVDVGVAPADKRPLQVDQPARRSGRSPRGPRAAGRWPPGRCGCGRCGACGPRRRSGRSGPARCACGCLPARCENRKRPCSISWRISLEGLLNLPALVRR